MPNIIGDARDFVTLLNINVKLFNKLLGQDLIHQSCLVKPINLFISITYQYKIMLMFSKN
jgi:hypothetical protein